MKLKDLLTLVQELELDPELELCVYDTDYGDRYPVDCIDATLVQHGYIDFNMTTEGEPDL